MIPDPIAAVLAEAERQTGPDPPAQLRFLAALVAALAQGASHGLMRLPPAPLPTPSQETS